MAPKYKLSDSESEAEVDAPVTPSDEVLEKGLRDEITSIFQSGKMEELTVKRVRLAAEKKLGLSEGFFKTTGDWKERSDRIIKEEAVRFLQFIERANCPSSANVQLRRPRKHKKTQNPHRPRNHLRLLHSPRRLQRLSDPKTKRRRNRESAKRQRPRFPRTRRHLHNLATRVMCKTPRLKKAQRHR